MQELLKKAGLTPEILRDVSKRTAAIDEYNAKVGGLRGLLRTGKLEAAQTHPIPSKIATQDIARYLKFVSSGKRVPILFAAGRATRMRLPALFDRLGIGGLTPGILLRINELKDGEDASAKKLGGDAKLLALVDAAVSGRASASDQLSFLQRQLLQYRFEMENLFHQYPQSGVSLQDWLARASFVVVANEENRDTASRQLAAIHFAGLSPEHVFMIIQQEVGGLEVLPDGTTRPYDLEVWPEGHGKPFMDMRSEGLLDKLSSLGVERAVFAQVNDLHLLEDMTHMERWAAADALITHGTEMVMEMVENGLSQKGGGIFRSPESNTVMRDTIAMKTKDLEPYAVPQSLSRMFYELSLSGMAKLTPDALPAYLTERKTVSGGCVLTREYYSGDASSVLRSAAIQKPGYTLETFKLQSRISHALGATQKQDLQPGFKSLQLV